MFRVFLLLTCYFLSSLSNAQLTNKTGSVYQISTEFVQPVIWQDIATIELPQGSPKLRKSKQVDLDAPIKVSWQAAGSFENKLINLSFNLMNSSFKNSSSVSPLPRWDKVKPAEYELNTLSDIRHFSVRQGLPTGSVYKTLQSEDGMLWLATNGEGVCQYIGEHFRCLKDEHGLNNNRVWDIEVDENNHYWLATDQGLSIFDGQRFSSLHINQVPFTQKVIDIALVKNSVFFITDSGLFQFKENQLFQAVTKQSIGVLNSLNVSDSSLLLGTTHGLLSLNENKLTAYQLNNNNCQGNVSTAQQVKTTLMIAIKDKGLCSLNLEDHLVSKLDGITTTNILAILNDSESKKLWLGDDSKGVVKIEGDRAFVFNEQNGLSDQNIRDLMKDAQGHVWASTYSSGINRISSSGFGLFNKHNGLLNERVSALRNINGNLWLGLYGFGIQVRDGYEWLEPEIELINPYVHSITQDNIGRVWVGSRQGLMVLGENSTKHIWREQGFDADIVHRIISAPDNCMYLATNIGLYRSCKGKFQLLSLEMAEYAISVYVDSKRRIWFVTNGGGTYYLEDGNVFKFSESAGFASNWAYTIEQDIDNTIYIGSRSGVIALKQENQSWVAKNITTKHGLSSSIVLALKTNEKHLWIGTERGNNRLSTENLFTQSDEPKVKSFVYDNGYLASDSTLNSAVFEDNKMYWGSGSGVTYFSPETFDFKPNLNSQILEIASLDESGATYYSAISKINTKVNEFSSDTRQIILKYTHSDWASPERILYQTRLLGSSEQWGEFSSLSQTSYNNLPAGNYEFQLRATNNGDLGPIVSYQFSLLPPWWQTWWAYLLAFSVLFLLIYLAMKLRFDFLRKQQRIKDRAEFSETLLARKKQLLAEVSHEIRTPLSVLKMQIEGLEHNIVEDTEKTYELLHRRISDINLLIADIDQLAFTELDELTLNVATIDVSPWLKAWCTDAKSRVNQQSDKAFSCEIKLPENLTIKGDKDRLTQVLSNLLSNSLRYTAPPAAIHLNANYDNEKLVISLSDSAPGVSDEELKSIFERMYQSKTNKDLFKGGTGLGLTICQDLVNRHGGTIIARHCGLGGLNVIITLAGKIATKE